MTIAVRLLRELWGLFVDDGSLAALLLAWTVVVALDARLLGDAYGLAGLLLVIGFVAILIENVRRSARAKRGRT